MMQVKMRAGAASRRRIVACLAVEASGVHQRAMGRFAVITLGARVYGLGAILLGVVELVFGAFAPGWLGVSARLPGYHLLVVAAGLVLVLGGLAINAPRVAGIAALALAAVFGVGLVFVQAPLALAHPRTWVSWQAVAESTVMTLGGLLAYAKTPRAAGGVIIARAVRWLFGASLLVFGISHFVYLKFTAAAVPAWLPPAQSFWAWATGVAQVAAGLAVLSGVQARVAAILLTVMYAGFGLLVHFPMVLANPRSHETWAENAVNFVLVGAAWGLAEMLSGPKSVRAAAR